MAVVIIVTVLATLASPLFVEQWREQSRGGRQAATQVAQVYSQARMRAMARGAAVMVRWNSATGFVVEESIEGTAAVARGHDKCEEQPGLGCLSNDWTSNKLTIQEYKTANAVAVAGKKGDGTAMTQMNVCFTPLGRSFVSYDGSAPTAPLVTTPSFDVQRLDNEGGTFTARGMVRTVVLLPNGTARLAL